MRRIFNLLIFVLVIWPGLCCAGDRELYAVSAFDSICIGANGKKENFIKLASENKLIKVPPDLASYFLKNRNGTPVSGEAWTIGKFGTNYVFTWLDDTRCSVLVLEADAKIGIASANGLLDKYRETGVVFSKSKFPENNGDLEWQYIESVSSTSNLLPINTRIYLYTSTIKSNNLSMILSVVFIPSANKSFKRTARRAAA